MTQEQLRHFERLLLQERAARLRALGTLSEEMGTTERDRTGNLSSIPFHLADLGTGNMQDEIDGSLMTNESRVLDEINAALARLYHDPAHFGLDERTGRPIPLARLELVPWARTARPADDSAGGASRTAEGDA